MHYSPDCEYADIIHSESLAESRFAQGMYPTLVVILCAVDKSLYEKSTDAEISIVFNGAPSNPRGTLSELVSSAADTDEEGTGCLSNQRISRATHQSAP
ncbi:hypothetical protein K466DRAFT_96110 [Polyporus arcularius HHB13444]|uniref:Uncharacterized protein n=1 Tax=Polyporus arcularius HHB13444 TaxID=1314778 RepID=A0A5C3PFP8_9APHY|nr:hypothetical protein K466DRAFT_96110 [Polyporus arcularius HHB13444]